jgi:hypothetical protein
VRHGAKNVSPALLPPFTFFTLQLGKVYLQMPAAILPRRGPGEAGHYSPTLEWLPNAIWYMLPVISELELGI